MIGMIRAASRELVRELGMINDRFGDIVSNVKFNFRIATDFISAFNLSP